MKVQTSLRRAYDQQRPLADRLKVEVDRALQLAKEPRWHYESRVKEIESFCVKVESGRVDDPEALEDFLACTFVVPNSIAIPRAVEVISKLYTVKYRRPLDGGQTSKAPDTFRFDDLRLYCARENDGTRPDEPLDAIIFEVQVKTFLQHAWSIATHDLSYKTDVVTWGKDRIVAHLKAAIEHAELSIQEAEPLSHSAMLQLQYPRTTDVSEIIGVFTSVWPRDELPANLRGLAETIQEILRGAGVTPAEFGELLEAEKTLGGGSMPLNLSPYGVALKLLVTHRREGVVKMLRSRKRKLLLTPELNLPEDFPPRGAAGQVVRVQ
jgi:hypothetical protein